MGVVVGMLVGRAGMLVGDGLNFARRELAGEHDAASFLPLLGQLLGDLRVMRADIPDQAGQETVGLQARA